MSSFSSFRILLFFNFFYKLDKAWYNSPWCLPWCFLKPCIPKQNNLFSAFFNLSIKFTFSPEILPSSCYRFITIKFHDIQVYSFSYGSKVFREQCLHFSTSFCIISHSVNSIYSQTFFWIKFSFFITFLFSSRDSFVGIINFGYICPVNIWFDIEDLHCVLLQFLYKANSCSSYYLLRWKLI